MVRGRLKEGGRGLGNPFVGKSFEEIDHMFRMKGLKVKYFDPVGKRDHILILKQGLVISSILDECIKRL